MLRAVKTALAKHKLPSLFSKSMGLTLWGIVEDPISPALVVCKSYACHEVFSSKPNTSEPEQNRIPKKNSGQAGEIYLFKVS